MRKAQLILLSVSSLLMTYFSCSHNYDSKSLDNWVGKYIYAEDPIKAIEGYYMTMQWVFSINKENDSCQGVLEVNGQQTFIKILTDISGDSNSVVVRYNSLIDGSDENLKMGDTLFFLTKIGEEIKTNWLKLEPRLEDNPSKDCNCFEIVTNNGH